MKNIKVQDTPTYTVGQTVRIRATGESVVILAVSETGAVQLAGHACLTDPIALEPIVAPE